MNQLADITNPALGALDPGTPDRGLTFFQKFVPALVSASFVIGALVFFFMLLIGAVQWIVSGGDKNSVEAARGRISQALIGLVILFAVFAVVKLIESFFGISILVLDIGALII